MKEMVCRLCLQTIVNDNCQPVEESLLKSLKLNINIGKENVMCIECANCLRVFTNITPSCVYMGDGTLPLSDLGIGVKLEPEAIETKTKLNSFMETEIKCSFCTKIRGREDLILLKESKENKFLVNMLERYILETNLKNNEDFLTCETCLVALQGGLTVILKCLDVEGKISEYIELEGTDDKGQVELKDVQQFMFRPIIKSEIESFGVNELEDRSVQIQEEYTTMAEAEIKYEKDIRNAELIIKAEDDDVTSEQSDCDIPDIKSEQRDYDGLDIPQLSGEECEVSNALLYRNMNEKICRLCLQTISYYNCQTLEESVLNSLKLNINISKENVMCIECANDLRMFSNFTPGRAYSEDETIPLSDLDSKLDPEAIGTTTNPKSLIETEIKCSFCTKAYGSEDLISLEDSTENKLMVNMLERYISEMNLKSAGELLSCGTCLESLEAALGVISKYLEVEENIGKYIESEGTDDKGQVELKDVQRFTFRPILKLEIESFGVNKLEDRCDQMQEEYTRMEETEIKEEKQINNAELIIKTEDDDDIASEQGDGVIPDIKSEESDCDGFQEPFDENGTPNDLLRISEVISETRKSKDVAKQHLLTHKIPSEIDTFICELCSYETKRKFSLRQHLLIHKSPSEIKMFKCSLCPYESKHNGNLKTHLLTHKSPSEIKMFKCALCPYEAKHNGNLKTHLLTHKSPSEIKVFKCELCSYEAKQKGTLKTHLLTHKTPSEIKMFKCELCSYEAKLKNSLKIHLLTHKSCSEINMFKCELCSYEGKQKGHLKTHLLTHKTPSEIKMFKCALCPFEAKRNSILKTHLLTHKTPSEIKMFKCALCPYEAKYNGSLKIHLLTHKSPSEIKMFKCETCSYETKLKGSLRQHLLIHKSPSEINMFKCALCPYEARQKIHLKRHILTHKSSSEINMFKCELYSYEGRLKS